MANNPVTINTNNGAFLCTIIQQLPCYVYWKNTAGVYLGCNELVLVLAGGVAVVGKTDFDLPWRVHASRIYANDQEVLHSKQTITIEESTTDAQGKHHVFLTYKIPLLDQQQIVGILGVSVDITDRKALEAELAIAKQQLEVAQYNADQLLAKMSREVIGESTIHKTATEHAMAVRHHLESIIACMPGNVYWMDKNSVYLGCNDNVIKTFGLKNRSEFIGMTYEKMSILAGWTSGQGDSFKRDDQEVIRSGQPKLNVEEPLITDAAGNVHCFLTSRVPLCDELGQVTGIVGISIDITDRKKIEAELLDAKEQVKTLFMENMSHDFKTPLNGIFGSTQILAAIPDLPSEAKEVVELQQKSVLRLKKLVDSILDFRRIYSGKIEIKYEELNLLEIIESIVHSLASQLQTKNIALVICYPNSIPRSLMGDSYCTTSIILNLMSNAVKFTSQGQVKIAVELLMRQNDAVRLCITVSDTGKGIPSDKLEQIFDRFHRLDLSNQGLTAGHGIGLAIVKELVQKLNGSIRVISEVGVGSAFFLELPFDVQSPFVSLWQREYAHVRILLVSDTETATDGLVQQLGENNVTRTTAQHALDELLQAAQRQHPYHMVIVDDELDFIEPLMLSKLITHVQAIPRLLPLLSTRAQDKHWFDQARLAGYYDFIIKPILPTELEDKIVTAWRKWSDCSALTSK